LEHRPEEFGELLDDPVEALSGGGETVAADKRRPRSRRTT